MEKSLNGVTLQVYSGYQHESEKFMNTTILYIRKPETISSRLDDQLVMMDIDKGKYFAMNPVATRVWELLEKPASVDRLCEILTGEYDVEPGRCREEVSQLIGEMEKLGLVTSE